jgi:hypothetical protein
MRVIYFERTKQAVIPIQKGEERELQPPRPALVATKNFKNYMCMDSKGIKRWHQAGDCRQDAVANTECA